MGRSSQYSESGNSLDEFLRDVRLASIFTLENRELSSTNERPGTLTPQEWNRMTDSLLTLSSIVNQKQTGKESGKDGPPAESSKQKYR